MDELARVQLENKKLRQRCVELDEIEEKLETYKSESESTKDKINSLQNKHNSLQQENQTLKEKITCFGEDNNILTKKIADIRNELREAKQENLNRAQTEMDLKQELQERDLLVNKIKSGKNLSKEDIENQQSSDIDELHKQLKEALGENEELNECLANADKLVVQHIIEKKDLEDKLAKIYKNSSSDPKQNQSVDELTQKLYKANALVQKHLKENEILQKRLEEQNLKIEKITQEQPSETSKGDDEATIIILAENKKLRKKYKKIKEDLVAAQKEIEQLRIQNN